MSAPLPKSGEVGAAAAPGEGPTEVHKRRQPDQWKQDARRLRREQTEAESKLWGCLRNRRLLDAKFRRQLSFGRYIADFCCLEHRLVVEVDGSQHLESPRDQTRTAWFNLQGFCVLRFWNSDVMDDLEGVLDAIAEHLADPHPAAKHAADLSRLRER
ncbi:MAG: endonuclease domain-containing protein [Candidatus Binataceae bacterium]